MKNMHLKQIAMYVLQKILKSIVKSYLIYWN